jgi:hypothetical protein
MKKATNQNLVIAIILSLALMLVPLGIGIIVAGIEKDTREIQEKLEVLEEEEWGDPEEMRELSAKYDQGVSSYAKMIFWVVLFIVGGYSLLLLLIAWMAWLMYHKNPEKLRTYRVLMSSHYVLQLGVIYVLADMLIDQFSLIILLFAILVVAALVYSAFNTYTKRICRMV